MGRKAFNVGHERREDNSDKYNKLDSAVSVGKGYDLIFMY